MTAVLQVLKRADKTELLTFFGLGVALAILVVIVPLFLA